MTDILPLLAAMLNAGTPLALAALGLTLNERAGVINLGAEGMMLAGAAAGFAVAATIGDPTLGFVSGALAGMALAAVFAVLAIACNANQYASGLAIMLLGTGLSAFAGSPFAGRSLEAGTPGLAWLAPVPVLGPLLAGQHPLVLLPPCLALALAWFLARTRAGLLVRAIGESPEAAHALGHPVRRIRCLTVLAGGLCCGLAGAYLSLVYTRLWMDGMVAGRGWIALALTSFALWRPGRVLLGAYLFGGVTILQFQLQGMGVPVAPQWLAMMPYLAAVVVLACMSRKPAWMQRSAPSGLGKGFSIED